MDTDADGRTLPEIGVRSVVTDAMILSAVQALLTPTVEE